MIIRKPYAFLIKNFKKVHIALFMFAIYIYFKCTKTYSFVNEFIKLSSYTIYSEAINQYVSVFSYFILLALITLSVFILVLLKRKDKPWKLYIIPVVQYSIILLSFIFIRGYFKAYTGVESTASLRIWRDLLFISQFAQLGIFIIFIIRIFGVDLKKFNFRLDEEYLELEQKDREELEININIDRYAFKRNFNKLIRNINYIYQEHKLIFIIIGIILVFIMGKNTVSYISSHKIYKEGKDFNTNGYSVRVNNSYYTDKSYNGTVISEKSSFVIVDISITNTIDTTRDVALQRFHLINGINDYSPTAKTYETEFQDLGNAYDTVKLKKGDTKRFLLIYKVDRKLKQHRFVLYYQELQHNDKYLRKIKLKIKDLSKIQEKDTLLLGDTFSINIRGEDENITIEEYEFADSITYISKDCQSYDCESSYTSVSGYKILKLKFGSDTYEGTDFIDFLQKYGKITYINNKNKKKVIDIKNALRKLYRGKYVYIAVPDDISKVSELNFEIIVRNKKYIYKII